MGARVYVGVGQGWDGNAGARSEVRRCTLLWGWGGQYGYQGVRRGREEEKRGCLRVLGKMEWDRVKRSRGLGLCNKVVGEGRVGLGGITGLRVGGVG